MAARLANVLYWLGTIIAALAIGGALIWNGVAIIEHQQVQQELAVVQAERPDNPFELELLNREISRMFADGAQSAEVEAYVAGKGYTVLEVRYGVAVNIKYQNLAYRADDLAQGRETSLILGSVLALGGLVSYGVGWAARYILRGPVK